MSSTAMTADDAADRIVGVARLAAQLPGLERLESAKVWPQEDGTHFTRLFSDIE